MDSEESRQEPRVRATARCKSRGEITLSHIPSADFDKVDGMTFGQYWMTVKDGKVAFSHMHHPLPGPTDDSEMLPFWRPVTATERATAVQETLFDEDLARTASPSIIIGSLCGYYYTPENYAENARQLESYGFACMRSRRGNDGRFWENWYLPGLWCAEGALKEAIENPPPRGKDTDGKKLDRALSFLSAHVQFGTLDVAGQRLAMSVPD